MLCEGHIPVAQCTAALPDGLLSLSFLLQLLHGQLVQLLQQLLAERCNIILLNLHSMLSSTCRQGDSSRCSRTGSNCFSWLGLPQAATASAGLVYQLLQ